MKKEKEIRERILEVSRELFFKFGFSRVSMDELAEKLGMSKKTIYFYFPSKKMLIDEMVNQMLARLSVGVEGIVNDRKMDFIEKPRRLLGFIGMQMAMVSPDFIIDLRKRVPDVWKRIDEFRREKILMNFGKLYQEGVKRGVFRSDVNQEFLVRMYANTVQSTLNPDVFSELPVSPADAFSSVLKVFFEGILTDRARVRISRAMTIPKKKEIKTKEKDK